MHTSICRLGHQIRLVVMTHCGYMTPSFGSQHAGGTPQRAAQAAQIAQLEETIADLRSQHQQLQNELAKKEITDQTQLQQLTSALEQVSRTGVHVQELEKILEDQSKQLAVAQVCCSEHSHILPACSTA